MATTQFPDVHKTELEYVNKRRAAAGLAGLSDDESMPLCGLAMSGGGIRSAIFNLGVLQAFHRSGVFPAIDFVSSVSGGGYVGTCLSVLLRDPGSTFPFDPHGPVVRYLRERSQYIDPAGLWLRAASILLLGLAVNLLTLAPVLLMTATVIAAYSRFRLTDLLGFPTPRFDPLYLLMLVLLWQTATTLLANLMRSVIWPLVLQVEREPRDKAATEKLKALRPLATFLLKCIDFVGGLLSMGLLASIADSLQDMLTALGNALDTGNWRPLHQKSAQSRSVFRHSLEFTVKVLVLFGVLELQPVVLRLIHSPSPAWSGVLSLPFWTAVLGAVAAIAPLLSTGGLPLGNKAATVAPYLAVTVGAVALYFACLLMAEWMLFGPAHTLWTLEGVRAAWSYAVAHPRNVGIAVGALLGVAVLYVVIPLIFFDLNERSIHGYYRDSLGETFVVYQTTTPGGPTVVEPEGDLKLSALNTEGSAAPYHLYGATLNLQTDRALRNTGRFGDFFLMTSKVYGNDRVGYAPTVDLERAYGGFTVASAMATSGAAVSPHMGLFTRRPLVLVMSLLNVRLGCWLPSPRHLRPEPWRPNPFWLFRELRGRLGVNDSSVYISDGGHLENSGVYQLLKRRCRIVFAVDASTDPQGQFESLAALQRYARVDLGVEIDIDVASLRPDADGRSLAHGAIGRIQYPADTAAPASDGWLVWIKSSLTGDESVEVASYKSRAKAFPHEPLSDQFFDEGQFEAYSLLGAHAATAVLASWRAQQTMVHP